jgi:hypothetical protein
MVVIRFKSQGIDIVAPRCRGVAAVQAIPSGSTHPPIVPARPRPLEGTSCKKISKTTPCKVAE